jgi:chemotaxis protein MotB
MSGKEEIIIVRRADTEDEPIKGGVWKIAHADFMTAMMAFFLVMWLINQTDDQTKDSVANFFNPVNLSQSIVDKKGLEEPKPNTPKDSKAQAASAKSEPQGGTAHQMRKPRFKEGALFQDPYAILAKIASEAEPLPQHALGAELETGDKDIPALPGGEVNRDPFDPLYWQVSPREVKRGEGKSASGTMPTPDQGKSDVRVEKPSPPKLGSAAPISGDTATAPAANVEVKRPQPGKEITAPADVEAVKADDELSALKTSIVRAMGSSSASTPQVTVRRTSDGTLISLTDDLNYSMFAVGSSEPDAKVVRGMASIGKALAARKGKIIVRGHTDARPFKSGDYDNWRLSQSRAQMALYMLVRGGLPEGRILSVEGRADREPLNKENANADENRRIEILLQE